MFSTLSLCLCLSLSLLFSISVWVSVCLSLSLCFSLSVCLSLSVFLSVPPSLPEECGSFGEREPGECCSPGFTDWLACQLRVITAVQVPVVVSCHTNDVIRTLLTSLSVDWLAPVGNPNARCNSNDEVVLLQCSCFFANNPLLSQSLLLFLVVTAVLFLFL